MPGAAIPRLRDYQDRDVAAIRAAFARWARVIYVAPTGSGKTVCFAYITSHAAAKGNATVVVTHRAEIADQISAALDAFGVPHGRIQPGYPETPGITVQVAMVVSLGRRIARLPEPALLVPDECHHVVAGSWQLITSQWTSAKVLGVTATPERLDGRGLREAFDTMVIGPSVRELAERGYLAPFKYLAPPTRIDRRACAARPAIGAPTSLPTRWISQS